MEWKPVEGKKDGCPVIDFSKRKPGRVSHDKGIQVKTIAVDVKRRHDKCYEWKDFKIQVRNDSQNSVCPLYRVYNPAYFLVVHFSPSAPFDSVLRFLKNGVTLRYNSHCPEENFVFFGHSAN